VTDLHTLADAISDSSPNIRAFALAVADKLEPAAPTPTPSGVWWAGPQPPDTSWTVPAGVMAVSTQADLKALCASGGKGGAYSVSGFTYNGNLDIGNRNGLTLYFDPAWKLIGPDGVATAGVSLHGAGLELYGGDVSNPRGGANHAGGEGVKVTAPIADTSFRWWGLNIHDCAAQGLSVQAGPHTVTGDVQVTTGRAGLNTSLDPHTVKGSGLHAAYICGGSAHTFGRWIIVAHDQATGAGVQVGAYAGQGIELWIAARDLTWGGDPSYAGAGFQPWGGTNQPGTVKNLLVRDAVRGIYAGSLTSGSWAIEHYATENVTHADVLEPDSGPSHVVLPS
jgi:hypothetical protein